MSQSESEEVFDVERIVDDRVVKGKRQYLIKWVNYAESQNTWEFEENLMCEELLTEYMENKKKKSMETKKPIGAKSIEIKKQAEPKKEIKAQTGPKKEQKKAVEEKNEVKKQVELKTAKQSIPASIEETPMPNTETFGRIISNDWDRLIASVVGAYLNKNGQLEVEVLMKDGTRATALGEEIRYKAPVKLIEFYEANLTFPE